MYPSILQKCKLCYFIFAHHYFWKLDLYHHHMSAILCKLLNHIIWSKLHSKVNLKPVELAVNSIMKLQSSQILVEWNFGHYIWTFRSQSQFTCKLTWKCNSFTYAHIFFSKSKSKQKHVAPKIIIWKLEFCLQEWLKLDQIYVKLALKLSSTESLTVLEVS